MLRPALFVLLAAFALSSPLATFAANPPRAGGDFDFYLLATQWLPGWCRAGTGKSGAELDAAACPARISPLLFHGLWPENTDGSYPQNCSTVGELDPAKLAFANPFANVLRNARTFVDHEWAKHGTCTPYYRVGSETTDPNAYYQGVNRYFSDALSRFGALTAPSLPAEANPAAIRRAFVRSNPAVPENSILLTCARETPDRRVLTGFWLCADKSLHAMACPAALQQYGCDGETVSTR
jgi:ribonuclease T2